MSDSLWLMVHTVVTLHALSRDGGGGGEGGGDVSDKHGFTDPDTLLRGLKGVRVYPGLRVSAVREGSPLRDTSCLVCVLSSRS